VCCSRVSPGSGVCRELTEETIEPESCVFVAGDNEGEELVSPVLKRASDAYGEYRVGLTQA
jgi:hypothetical protein